MFVTTVIIGVSLFLFVYWFRCTVHLILRASPELAQQPAATPNLVSFLDLRQQSYAQARGQSLPILCEVLQKEYRVLTYLLDAAKGPQGRALDFQQRLLMYNFRFLTLWFGAVHRVLPDAARAALAEMSATVEYFSRQQAFATGATRS